MTDTKKLLAIKYGAILTLDEVAPYFNCSKSASIKDMHREGKFPIPIITLRRRNITKPSKVVHVEHLAEYIDKMKKQDERIFNSDVKAMES